jgi:transcriptional regulator with PAS, ATPase and Fis domain
MGSDPDIEIPEEDDDELVLPTTTTLHTVKLPGSRDRARTFVPKLEFRVIAGPDAGVEHHATSQRVVIGVNPKADFVLTDKTVSRFHCEVAIEGERVVIRDLQSGNGTSVNGTSIVHAHLMPGARLTLGHTEIEFGVANDPVELELSSENRFGSMVGESTAMRAAFALLRRAAATDATLLLTGETGTGKEVAAESVHKQSARRDGPFVIVDCGAIPARLMESELFGHEKGAFTGAVSAREGAFEAANGGTIFLDEVGELESELQPKLLRALERRHVKRVGATRFVPVDVRVIAATNRNLQSEVNARRFRSDLYYRLAVIEVRLPAMRERREDLPLLIEHILTSLGAADRKEAHVLRTEACRVALGRHPWPGNVRELRNYVERALALADFRVAPGDAPSEAASDAEIPPGTDLRTARESMMRDFERKYLESLLNQHAGNVSAAARAAGIDRKYFYKLLWRNGLR